MRLDSLRSSHPIQVPIRHAEEVCLGRFSKVDSMVVMLVPLKGGRWHSPSPNWQYVPLIETTIDRFGFPTLPETNSEFTENGWLEYDPFLLGFCIFSGAILLVSGRVKTIPSEEI